MKKSSIIIIIFVSLAAIFFGYNYMKDKYKVINEDAIKFKKEYEKLNNTLNSNNNKTYPKVGISSNNVIKYSTYDEIIKVLKEGTGVIYLGYPECPWCRNMVPVLLNAAEETGIDSIYYLNIKEDRDLLVLDEKNKIKVQKEGSTQYYALVEVLSEILDDYILTSNKGVEVNTNKKRIYVPLVVFVKNGEIVGYHANTVESQKDPYKLLSDRQKEELLLIYIDLMNMLVGDVCDENC